MFACLNPIITSLFCMTLKSSNIDATKPQVDVLAIVASKHIMILIQCQIDFGVYIIDSFSGIAVYYKWKFTKRLVYLRECG